MLGRKPTVARKQTEEKSTEREGGMMVARVFPRRTKATPTDALAFTEGPGMFPPDVDAVHVSVTFTYDMARAEQLALEWERVAPVSIGGPATGMRGEGFVPGMYLKPGYVITSRGCPNRCWFCSVWKRDGHEVRTLPICDGWNVLDDNLLACPEEHIRAVFAMLKRQDRKAEFTGGLEAARLKPWHVDLMADLKPKRAFFAYDTPEDWEPLVEASRMLGDAGLTRGRAMRAYVLIGWPRDTMEAADRRLRDTLALGIWPMAMLWRDKCGKTDRTWRRFQRLWARPALIAARNGLSKAPRAPQCVLEAVGKDTLDL